MDSRPECPSKEWARGCSRSAYGTQMGAYGSVRLQRKSAISTTAATILPKNALSVQPGGPSVYGPRDHGELPARRCLGATH